MFDGHVLAQRLARPYILTIAHTRLALLFLPTLIKGNLA